jgi:chloramphenicol-sensitive protein RarD
VGAVRGDERRGGLLYGVAAYGLWGLMPLYFRAVTPPAGPVEVLAHRIVWSVVFLALVLTGLRRWPDIARCFRSRRLLLLLTASTVLIAVNWFGFIYAVWSEQILQTSLGYFMTPLFSVVLGMIFFRERLRPGQWAALTLATCGIGYLVWTVGEVPWIALTITGSFGLYGLVRKKTPVDALVGLSVETLLLLPPAAGAILFWAAEGTGTFGRDGRISGLLTLSGVFTAVPLLCFGAAARRLPLTILGFLQYISPSMSCLLAVLWFDEPFRSEQRVSFGLIWAALALFTVESVLATRRGGLRRTLEGEVSPVPSLEARHDL